MVPYTFNCHTPEADEDRALKVQGQSSLHSALQASRVIETMFQKTKARFFMLRMPEKTPPPHCPIRSPPVFKQGLHFSDNKAEILWLGMIRVLPGINEAMGLMTLRTTETRGR